MSANAIPSLLKRHVLMSLQFTPLAEVEAKAVAGLTHITIESGEAFVVDPSMETDTTIFWRQLPDARLIRDKAIIHWYSS